MPPLNIGGETFKNNQNIAKNFKTYFTNLTDRISVNNSVTFNCCSSPQFPSSNIH
jgi:hypothetical protein